MVFEIHLIGSAPLTTTDDFEEVAIGFLNQLGFFERGYDANIDYKSLLKSVGGRLCLEYLFKYPERGFRVEELAVALDASKPAIYRHINKLKNMELVEEVDVPDENGKPRKGYRLKYGNIVKAIYLVKEHASLALDNYLKTAEHLQTLIEKRSKI